jgi:peptide methionine sulfoxide reductase MsrA
MKQHTHDFVETYEGFVGFGFDRETDQNTVIYYLQKFSDDNLQEILTQRMSDEDLEHTFNNISTLLGKYLSESEYHQLFLKNHGE